MMSGTSPRKFLIFTISIAMWFSRVMYDKPDWSQRDVCCNMVYYSVTNTTVNAIISHVMCS